MCEVYGVSSHPGGSSIAEQPIQKARGSGVWEHFTIQDGLPDMKIECLFEDSRGYLWIGTHDRGAVRFDGDRFESFTIREGLPGDSVFSILEDPDGDLWLGTDMGLTRYDGRMFRPMRHESEDRYSGLTWGRCVDQEGRLWFALAGQPGCYPATYRWDGRRLDLVLLTETGESLRQQIRQIVSDDRGDLWFGGNGLYRYDGETFHSVLEPSHPSWNISSLLARSDGSLWIGAANGLFVYREGEVQHLNDELAGCWIQSLLEDPSDDVWIATYEGYVIQYEKNSFRSIENLDATLWGNLCLDHMGRLWFGSQEGLYCYDTTRFEVFQEEQGLPSNRVSSLVEDTDGALWMSTRPGIVKYDGETFRPLEGCGEEAASAFARAIPLMMDRDNRLWMGTWDGELYVYDGGELRLVGAFGSGVACLAEDKMGRVWFGLAAEGIWYYEEGEAHCLTSDAEAMCPHDIEVFLIDRQGLLWIGSWTREGLWQYDGESFIAFTCSDGLAGNGVKALCEDRDGRLWIGTSEGISCYDGKSFLTFTKNDGLSHEIVTAITQTEDGRLWFGTEGEGVCCYDGKVFQTVRLPGDTVCNVIRLIHQDRSGRIWFGTRGGLVRYNPQRTPPEVAIDEIVADRPYGVDEDIEIPTTVTRIDFRFHGRSPVDRASRLVYRYRLEGYEENWHQTRSTHADYPQLSPGQYRFSVQAVDTDLNYSDIQEIHLKVISDPRVAGLTEALRSTGTSGELVGKSPALHKALFQIEEVAGTDLTVLILGETGTGKGLAARAIHGMSVQKDGPFIPVNCGGIPEGLVESELFGHEKGAFTGAVSRKLGKVELAEEGTLFLDEIGDLPLLAQAKLLRFLEERTFERVGGEVILRASVRVIAATNRDLEQMVSIGQFREDLYYRLQGFVIHVPPLRERREDIPLLVKYFADRFASHLDRPVPRIDPMAIEHLQQYGWPGNVRELEHQVQRAVLSCSNDVVSLKDVRLTEEQEEGPSTGTAFRSLEEQEQWHEEQEKRHIERALEATSGVIYGEHGAARLLGINPEKLRVRMRKYGLRRPRG